MPSALLAVGAIVGFFLIMAVGYLALSKLLDRSDKRDDESS